jgi:putative inorganic carbon (HCO3(-)) transporter
MGIANTPSIRGKKNTSSSATNSLQMGQLFLYLLPLLLSVAVGVASGVNFTFGVALVGIVVAFFVFILCLVSAEAGLYTLIIYSFSVSAINRLFFNDLVPVGVFADILTGVVFIGYFVRRDRLGNDLRSFVGNRVGVLIIAVYAYTLLEVFNPAGLSLAAAIPVIRKVLGMFMIAIISYSLFKDQKSIKRFITFLFIACTLVALYACIQEWHGFFDFEMNWLRANARRYRMTFVNGGARRMSSFLDAVSLSVVMSVGSVFFTGLIFVVRKPIQKITLAIGVFLMLLAMGYSLTRTANVMFVAGIFLFMLINLDKLATRIVAVVGFIFFLVVLYGPFYGNNQIAQFRQTFKGGTKDPSYLVREINRKQIQPYLWSHPFGGGLTTTGEEGLMYHPGHRLAGFPPDSGYLKKALELGWVGFGLLLFLYFSVLQTGIRGSFSSSSPPRKMLLAACTGALFAFYVGDFSQVTIGQITDVVVYYPLIAIILRLAKNENTSPNTESLTV